MSTEILPAPTTELLVQTATEKTISDLSVRVRKFRVTNPDDADQVAEAKALLKECVTMRTSIDKYRKKINADLLEEQRRNNAAAKELEALTAPNETHMLEQIKIIDAAAEAKKKAEADRIYRNRCILMERSGVTIPEQLVRAMDDGQFTDALLAAETELKAQREREAAAAKAAEDARIAADNLAKQQAELAEAQAKLDQERAEQETEKSRLNAELEQTRRELAAMKAQTAPTSDVATPQERQQLSSPHIRAEQSSGVFAHRETLQLPTQAEGTTAVENWLPPTVAPSLGAAVVTAPPAQPVVAQGPNPGVAALNDFADQILAVSRPNIDSVTSQCLTTILNETAGRIRAIARLLPKTNV